MVLYDVYIVLFRKKHIEEDLLTHETHYDCMTLFPKPTIIMYDKRNTSYSYIPLNANILS